MAVTVYKVTNESSSCCSTFVAKPFIPYQTCGLEGVKVRGQVNDKTRVILMKSIYQLHVCTIIQQVDNWCKTTRSSKLVYNCGQFQLEQFSFLSRFYFGVTF